MALGGDQGGSIRMPSAYCGTYGMKPTHGLVPYTGIVPIELTIDHTGPITANVADNALLLEVLAGPDGLDPRQYGGQSQPYREALGKGAAGLRIAVVKEGFGWMQSMPQVDASVQAAADRHGGGRGHRVDPTAPHGRGDLAAGSGRGRHDADDAGQRLRLQLAGAVRHLDAGFPQRLAHPRRRTLGHAEKHHAAGPLHGKALPRALLRQGAEPGAPAARRLRRDAGRIRSAAHADGADDRDPAAGRECAGGREFWRGHSRCCPPRRRSTAPTIRR